MQRHSAAQVPAEVLGVGAGGATGLLRRGPTVRSLGDGLVDRLGQLSLTSVAALHAADFIGQVVEVLFHAGVGGIVLSGQDALVVPPGVEEVLHRVPEVCTLGAKFSDSHDKFLHYMNFLMSASRALRASMERPSGFAGSGSASLGFTFSASLLNRALATALPEYA